MKPSGSSQKSFNSDEIDGEHTKMKKKKSKDRGLAQELADVVTHVQGISFKTFEDRSVSLSPPYLFENYLLSVYFRLSLCVCLSLWTRSRPR